MSSNPLGRLERYASTCTQIEAQYGSLEIMTAKNLGAGLSVRSGTRTSTKSAEFRIQFALLAQIVADWHLIRIQIPHQGKNSSKLN